ncbi:MAG: hypothetical protein ACTSW1_05665 [Candidatus Hodarchaeales archaeon]
MARYPISYNGGKRLSDYFEEILDFHVPASKIVRILDPTCGKRHLWINYFQYTLNNNRKIDEYGEVVFSDVKDLGYNIVSSIADLEVVEPFSAIVYDPPYFFGYDGSDDPRKEDYGDYIQSYEDLKWFMEVANEKFPDWLTEDGKVILKCADQYQTKERKFYSHQNTWINTLTNFEIIDTMIFTHHRMSPTAFQVKDRPCSVIMHTYFLVFKKKNSTK